MSKEQFGTEHGQAEIEVKADEGKIVWSANIGGVAHSGEEPIGSAGEQATLFGLRNKIRTYMRDEAAKVPVRDAGKVGEVVTKESLDAPTNAPAAKDKDDK